MIYIVKILDDLLFIAKSKVECQRCLNVFLDLCREAGIPVAPHKTVGPCWCLIFLGVELDTADMQARLPIEKIEKYRKHVEEIQTRDKVTLRELQSVIGQLQYATCIMISSRTFLRCLINLTIGHMVPHYFIKLTRGVKLDLEIWKSFLDYYNGISFLYEPHVAVHKLSICIQTPP